PPPLSPLFPYTTLFRSRLGRFLCATSLRRDQGRRQVDRRPPGLGERSRIAAPGGLRHVTGAAADLDGAAAAGPEAAGAQALQQCLAVPAAAERRMGKPQQVGDGALDFVESAFRAEAIAAMVRPVRVLHARSVAAIKR